MGTEQRVTATQVPPRKEIFDYIVFNANHIKSFQPIIKTDAVLDPAIIATMGDSNRAAAPKSGGRGPSKKPPAYRTNIMKMLDDGSQRVRTVDMNRLMGHSGSSRNSSSKSSQRGQNNAGEVLMGRLTRNNNKDENRGGNRKQQSQRGAAGSKQKNKKQTQSNSPSKQSARHVSFKTDSSKQAESQPGERRQFTHIPQIPRSILNREGRRNSGQESRAQSSPRRQRSGVVPGSFPPRKTPVKFDEEFDFDKALEEFRELSITERSKDRKNANERSADGEPTPAGGDASKETSGPGDAGNDPPGPAYNQDKSFYDNLTTTTEIDGQQRPSRREVMLANKETFGVSYLPGRRFRGRGNSFQRPSSAAQRTTSGGRPGSAQATSRKQNQRNPRQRAVRRTLGTH
ncbi:protein LSM14B-B-like [Tropilaelaps mercedesae]|uniref:Protein LSM14B-B-like n=1 Tax=Tropilaelaps mercedesae TaxID=418985 RepID=A0A1V9Y0M2_9ACAR|nr:protein LSM14B-B-like [Tropilaelaps mercedesae]